MEALEATLARRPGPRPLLRMQSDERLVDLVQAGFDPAFAVLVARHWRPLHRYSARLVSEDRAEDVVQQTFIRAYEKISAGGGVDNLRPWLYRVAHNAALDALKDRALQHVELHEDLNGVERPDQAFERREGLREAVAAVKGLPARQRDAIVLRELEGRSYEEIARELGTTDGAVRQLLGRARTTLRAGCTALTPYGLYTRVPWGGSDHLTARVVEIVGGTGAPVVVAQVCAAAILSCGGLVGGSTVKPDAHSDSTRAGAVAPAAGGLTAPTADVAGPFEAGVRRVAGLERSPAPSAHEDAPLATPDAAGPEKGKAGAPPAAPPAEAPPVAPVPGVPNYAYPVVVPDPRACSSRRRARAACDDPAAGADSPASPEPTEAPADPPSDPPSDDPPPQPVDGTDDAPPEPVSGSD